jgi:hypothetical protein
MNTGLLSLPPPLGEGWGGGTSNRCCSLLRLEPGRTPGSGLGNAQRTNQRPSALTPTLSRREREQERERSKTP